MNKLKQLYLFIVACYTSFWLRIWDGLGDTGVVINGQPLRLPVPRPPRTDGNRVDHTSICWLQLRKVKVLGAALMRGKYKRSWVICIKLGPGAGYTTSKHRIPGYTLYFGRFATHGYRLRRFVLGFTRNANRIPYPEWS